MPIKPENKKLYPKNWKAIRTEILNRANWECECMGECGLAHKRKRCHAVHLNIGYWSKAAQGITFQTMPGIKARTKPRAFHDGKVIKIVLTIAHLNHNPKDSRRRNLKAMCQRCHLRYDSDQHAKNAAKTRRKKRKD